MASGGDSVLVCPQFVGVSADGSVPLASIQCPADKTGRDQVTLMTLFGDGATDQTYYWTELDDGYGWMDDATGEREDGIVFQPGQALWAQCDADDPLPFKSSGEVSQKDIVFELATGGDSVTCGNATPVGVDIQDILCPATKAARDMVTVMTLFGDGATDQTYYWTELDDGYGWMDDATGEKAEGITIPRGQGLWVQCDAEDPITLTIPGVELTK